MAINEITHPDYVRAAQGLEGLSFEEGSELRSLLAAKYYAYLDKAIQCKKAIREYHQVVRRINAAACPGKAPTDELKFFFDNS